MGFPIFWWIWVSWSTRWERWWRGYSAEDPLGKRAEDLAARYVRRQLRMRILARNVRCPGGELDIVALAGETLVFIEVRSLSDTTLQQPEATVGLDKREFLRRSARWFLRTRRLSRFEPRGDLVAIVWPKGGKPQIRYHRGAWVVESPVVRRRK